MLFDISSFPCNIQEQLSSTNYSVNNMGMSGANVLIFEDQVLKISKDSKEAYHEVFMLALMNNNGIFCNHLCNIPKFFCTCMHEDKHYLLMSKIHGKVLSALIEENKNSNVRNLLWIIPMLANMLQEMWRIPIRSIPYHHLDLKLAMAKENISLERIDRLNMETNTLQNFKNEKQLLQWLIDNRPQEEWVFSHGDCTVANIIVLDQQRLGLIDFTRSGISDKYQDIALLYRSLNDYGGAYLSDAFLQCLGIKKNDPKICYYILLDELF